MNRLRIGYFADGPWAHKALELLLADDTLEIVFIVPRISTSDNLLEQYAKDNNIDYLVNSKINTEEFYQKAVHFNCDLFISMSFDQIFKDRIISLPRLKTINCHAGKLPFYRGRNILNWVLINDEKEYGITVHYIDEGIDTGDIILQRTFPITDQDTYKTLLDRSYEGCANILYDAVKQIQDGTHKPIQQETIDPVGFYCGKRGIGDEIINWNQSSRAIFNFVRSICKPGPVARAFIGEKEVLIHQAREIKGAINYINTPGQIVGKHENALIVKTANSVIQVTEYESKTKIRIGDRFQ